MQRLRSALVGCLLAGGALFAAPRPGRRLTDLDFCYPRHYMIFFRCFAWSERSLSLGLTPKGWDQDAIADWFAPLPPEEIILPGPLPLVIRRPSGPKRHTRQSAKPRCHRRPRRSAPLRADARTFGRTHIDLSPTTVRRGRRG